jgi:hypothetical protein
VKAAIPEADLDFPPLPDPFGENAQLPPYLRTRFGAP